MALNQGLYHSNLSLVFIGTTWEINGYEKEGFGDLREPPEGWE